MRKKPLHLAVSVAESARWSCFHNPVFPKGRQEQSLQERPIRSLVLPQHLLFENPTALVTKQINLKRQWLTVADFGLLNTARILLQDLVFSLYMNIRNLRDDVIILRN